MRYPPIAEFLANKVARNAWVLHESMEVYVRRAFHNLGSGKIIDTFDLANMSSPVKSRGKGSLWRLVELVAKAEPDRIIYVESVLNVDLTASLRRRGWIELPALAPSFWRRENFTTVE